GARGADRPSARDARAGTQRRARRPGRARAGLSGRQPRDRAGARLLGAAPERARARRGRGADRARAPRRRGRTRDHRRGAWLRRCTERHGTFDRPRAGGGRAARHLRLRRRTRRGGLPRVRTQEVVIVVRRGSDFLVVHRSPENDAYWHLIAGGVEEGESFAEAAARELREETSLDVAVEPLDSPFQY